MKADPGEKTDVADKHPDVVKELDQAYDTWWASVQPQLVNENAVGPKVNPFMELYQKQFRNVPELPKPGSCRQARTRPIGYTPRGPEGLS